jgi:hypothetical protein
MYARGARSLSASTSTCLCTGGPFCSCVCLWTVLLTWRIGAWFDADEAAEAFDEKEWREEIEWRGEVRGVWETLGW